MYVGGTANVKDSTTNMAFLVRLVCDTCGYVMLFDLEKFVKPDEQVYEPE